MKPYHTQKWPFAVMRQALSLRSQGLSLRATAARLAETHNPAPPWHTVRSWSDCTIKRAAKIMMEIPMPKLVWRDRGHLSDPDAGYALCGAPVRFHGESRDVAEADACRACLLRAESQGREFAKPVRKEFRVEREGQAGLCLEQA